VPTSTALVLPVPEASSVVDDPHIVLLAPFLPVDQVDDGVLAELRQFFAEVVPFAFVLGEVARFPGGTPYLPPQPVTVFRRMTHALRQHFPEAAPTATNLETWVPHLRVGEDVGTSGPIEAHAREALLLVTDPDGTRVMTTFRFGTSAA
jgi:hypothetical protein